MECTSKDKIVDICLVADLGEIINSQYLIVNTSLCQKQLSHDLILEFVTDFTQITEIFIDIDFFKTRFDILLDKLINKII